MLNRNHIVQKVQHARGALAGHHAEPGRTARCRRLPSTHGCSRRVHSGYPACQPHSCPTTMGYRMP